MVSLNRPIMPNEERTKLECMISAAIRDTRTHHPNSNMVELTSSIIKRLIPNLLNAYHLISRTANEDGMSADALREELARVRRNAEQNSRDTARLQKKKVRQDKRMRVMVEAMRELAAQGNERALQAMTEYDLID